MDINQNNEEIFERKEIFDKIINKNENLNDNIVYFKIF